jgi:peptidoglycan/LPS O-acetylase OafA/YrhL
VYKPTYLAFLNNRVVTRIGVISYGLYLINENVGLILINKLSAFTTSPFIIKIVPLFVLLVMIILCELAYRFYEKPVNAWLRSIWLKRGRNTGKELQPK